MTLPTSGPITFQDINVELGRPATTPMTLNDADVRSLAGKPTGPITLADFWGKSAVPQFGDYTINVGDGALPFPPNRIVGYNRDGSPTIGSLVSVNTPIVSGVNLTRAAVRYDLNGNDGFDLVFSQNIFGSGGDGLYRVNVAGYGDLVVADTFVYEDSLIVNLRSTNSALKNWFLARIGQNVRVTLTYVG